MRHLLFVTVFLAFFSASAPIPRQATNPPTHPEDHVNGNPQDHQKASVALPVENSTEPKSNKQTSQAPSQENKEWAVRVKQLPPKDWTAWVTWGLGIALVIIGALGVCAALRTLAAIRRQGAEMKGQRIEMKRQRVVMRSQFETMQGQLTEMGKQTEVLRKSVEAAGSSARAAWRSIELTNRSHLTVGGWSSYFQDIGKFDIRFFVLNVTATTALVQRVSIRVGPDEQMHLPDFDGRVIAPHDSAETKISYANIDWDAFSYQSGYSAAIDIDGEISYSDDISREHGESHLLRFKATCVRSVEHATDPAHVSFIHTANYEKSDETCEWN
jgi:hypothetical protein